MLIKLDFKGLKFCKKDIRYKGDHQATKCYKLLSFVISKPTYPL